ncbi:MAG: hypothetical protein AB4372_29520, partial [Xenococcus sp. (in: cyanobacteria)]
AQLRVLGKVMSTKRRASLTRHGQSLWNAQNKFTGWVGVPIENLTPEEVTKLELATGAPIVYEFDSQAQVTDKILL